MQRAKVGEMLTKNKWKRQNKWIGIFLHIERWAGLPLTQLEVTHPLWFVTLCVHTMRLLSVFYSVLKWCGFSQLSPIPPRPQRRGPGSGTSDQAAGTSLGLRQPTLVGLEVLPRPAGISTPAEVIHSHYSLIYVFVREMRLFWSFLRVNA